MFHKANSSVLSNAKKDASKRAKDTPIRKSDRRNLRDRAIQLLQLSNIDTNEGHEKEVLRILDASFLKGSLVSRQIQLPDVKATLYLRSPAEGESDWPFHLNPECIWIELDSKNLVPNNSTKPVTLELPSVALLSVLPPNSLPTVIVPQAVSRFVCRGADLMRPGMRGFIPPTKPISQELQAVSVVIQGNPQPFAVGLLAPDLNTDFRRNSQQSGVGVTIVTAYGDDLWQHQLPSSMADLSSTNLFDQGHYGNAGFLKGQEVVSIQTTSDTSDDEDTKDPVHAAEVSDECDTSDSGSNKQSASQTETVDNATSEADQDKHQKSPEVILHEAVCRALASIRPSEKKTLLPLKMATFYAHHVLPNRSSGTLIELKRTKYKKFGAYVAEQVERGLLIAAASNDGGQPDPFGILIGFDAHHPDVREFASIRNTSTTSSSDQDSKTVLTELYCIPPNIQSLLRLDKDTVKARNATSEERKGTGMLTLTEIRAVLDDYIDRENLADTTNRNWIIIDGALKDSLYKKKKGVDADGSAPERVSRKNLVTEWAAKMERAYALVEVPGNKILRIGRGQAPSITIEVSRRQSNKFITLLRGFDDYKVEADLLCNEVSQRFACSAKVVTTPRSGKKDGTELLIQGNLAQELEALLSGDASKTSHGGAKDSPFRLPKNAINVVLRKGVPARKKGFKK